MLGASALFGLPPFSIVATAAGMLAIRLAPFCSVIFVGRAVRFVGVVAITAYAMR